MEEPLWIALVSLLAKAGQRARIKYPKKIKDVAVAYFKANPSLIPGRETSHSYLLAIDEPNATLTFNIKAFDFQSKKALDR
jgi:hypothetical protein